MKCIMGIGIDMNTELDTGYIYNTNNWSLFYEYLDRSEPPYKPSSFRLVDFENFGETSNLGIYNISFQDSNGNNQTFYFMDDKNGPWIIINKIKTSYGNVSSCILTDYHYVQLG